MSQFERQRKKLKLRHSMMQKLCYGMLEGDDVIVNKDGSLTCCFNYCGDDIQVMSQDHQAQICERYSRAASQYWQEDLLIEADFIRYEATEYQAGTHFPDNVSALIDIERQLQFEQSGRIFQNKVTYSFTLRETNEIPVGVKKLVIETDEGIKEKTLQERIQDFKEKLDQFISYVTHGRAYQYRKLSGDALVTYLNTCLTHQTRTIKAPAHKLFLDSYLAQDFIAGMEPVIAGKKVRVITVDMLPDHIQVMLMDELNRLSLPFRFHSRFMLLSQNEAAKYLKRLQRTWSSKAIGLMGMITNAMGGNAKINESAARNQFDIQECQHENDAKEVKFGWYNLVFVLMDEDSETLNQQTQDLIKVLENHNLQLRIENVNATEAYLGSLPAHGGYNVRMNLMDSRVWSATLPLSAIYSGEIYCPNPYYPKKAPALLYGLTDLNNIYHFNNSVNDVGHSLILGPTGAGKTTLLNLIMAQHRKYDHSRQIVLDCNYSSLIAITAMEGRYVKVSEEGELISNDQQHQLALFEGIENKTQCEAVINWCVDLFTLQGVAMTTEHQAEIRAAVERMKTLPEKLRCFSNMVFDSPELRATFKELRQTLFGQLINGTQDFLSDQQLLGIEVGQLRNVLPEKQLQPFIQLLLNKLTRIFEDRLPTLLILDEAWLFLDHPVFAHKIKEWLKTLRKLNVAVIFASQSLADIAECSITSVLIESCVTKIYLPNADADKHASITKLYEQFGLTPQECSLLANSTPKKDYYIKQAQGSRLVDFNLGELALQFLSLDKKSDRELFQKIYQKNNPHWLVNYLNEKQLVEAASVAEQLIEEKVSA